MTVEAKPAQSAPQLTAPAEAPQVQITMGPTKGGRLRNAFSGHERAANQRMDDADAARDHAARAKLAELKALIPGDVSDPEQHWRDLALLAQGKGPLAPAALEISSRMYDTGTIRSARLPDGTWVTPEEAEEAARAAERNQKS